MNKAIIFFVCVVELSACTDENEWAKHQQTVEITFLNGDKDTVTVDGHSLYLDQGDLGQFGWKHVFASGVRTYKVLNK